MSDTTTEQADKLEQALRVILDCVDYTNNACSLTEMVGAVLPTNVIALAHTALTASPRPAETEAEKWKKYTEYDYTPAPRTETVSPTAPNIERFNYNLFVRTKIANYYAISRFNEQTGQTEFTGSWANINNGAYPAPCLLELNCEYIVEIRSGEIKVNA